MTIVTRFAPSPTGFLHIGSARTALFNWLFARQNNGIFYLRIEDTDYERSTREAVDAIFESLQWLGLNWDSEVVFQSKNCARHQEVGHELLKKNRAYYCTCTPDELTAMREKAKTEGKPLKYNGHCRDKNHTTGALRLRIEDEGSTTIDDIIQGAVTVSHAQLDDMVMLRSDGTPTYMLSVVVDDHDMAITHIVRGDDHLTNAFRQTQLYKAMGWTVPTFGHIPLIHGPDGAKLSKRHGALGAEEYKNMGYLPEAMRNYLLRLGWGYGDKEIIPDEKALKLFSLNRIGKSPARFDIQKLESLNAHYMKEKNDHDLVTLTKPFMTIQPTAAEELLLERGMPGLKQRAKTLVELARNALFYIHPLPLPMDEKAQNLATAETKKLAHEIYAILSSLPAWDHDALETTLREFSEKSGTKLGALAQPLRLALTGSTISPSVFEIMEVWGKEKSLERIHYFIEN
jgi:glutamyl-tRNA synthetase